VASLLATLVAAALTVCLLAACGEPDAAGDAPSPKDRCRGGPTRPLDVQAVIDVGRRHGITLYRDPACIPDPTVVDQASNLLLYGPHTNVDDHDDIERREGAVTCLLRAEPSSPRAEKVERVRYPGDEETHFTLLNVDCIIYPEPDAAQEQLARLEQVMEELERRASTSG
jgi:hypothetical protein